MSHFLPGQYAIASGLRGFRNRSGDPVTEMRVRVVKTLSNGTDVNVVTADIYHRGLGFTGCPLTLDSSQMLPLEDTVTVQVYSHKDGLVGFAA